MSKAKEEGVESMSAARTEAMGRGELRNMMGLQLWIRMPKLVAGFQMRRGVVGKVGQTLLLNAKDGVAGKRGVCYRKSCLRETEKAFVLLTHERGMPELENRGV